MKSLVLVISLTFCLHYAVRGQNQNPDDVYSIGQTNFAFYANKNQTEVMAGGFTIFDNSRNGFGYVNGAQRVDLFLVSGFTGRWLTNEPSSIRIVFESRSSQPWLSKPGMGTLVIDVDDQTIVQAGLAVNKSTRIGMITWEQVSYDVTMPLLQKLLTANHGAVLKLGRITHYLTASELLVFKDFSEALRLGNSTEWRSPQRACALFKDLGIKAENYRYVGLNTYGCPSPSTYLTKQSSNTFTFRPEGNKDEIKELVLVLRIVDSQTSFDSQEAFAILSGVLAERSLGIKLPDMLLLAIATGKSYLWKLGQNSIEVTRSHPSEDGAYELRFSIK
jgi:hypothetical protein